MEAFTNTTSSQSIPRRKVTVVYGTPELPQLRREYLLTLLELVGDENRAGLVSRIQEVHRVVQVRNDHTVEARDDNRPKVFLADGTPDLNKDRRMLRDYLEPEGYCVVPNRSFYNGSPAAVAETERLLESSELFIQVLGRFHFDTTETFPDGYEVWQIVQARRLKGDDVLRWRRPDFQEADIEEPAHRAFVFDKDVIACDLPEFKTTLAAKLKEVHNRIDDAVRVLNEDVRKKGFVQCD